MPNQHVIEQVFLKVPGADRATEGWTQRYTSVYRRIRGRSPKYGPEPLCNGFDITRHHHQLRSAVHRPVRRARACASASAPAPHLETRRSSITLSESNDSSPEDMDEKTPTTTRNRQEVAKDASHRFSKRTKKWLLVLLSVAAMFSPLASSIYFPSTKAIATDLHVSIDKVHLSITIFMYLQGIAPSFWAPLADARGRRVTFIGTFIVFLVANIGLATSNDYASLMGWRAVQAIGSAATIPIGSGAINDVTSRAEIGGYIGLFSGMRQFGQAFGPVIGALLTQWLRWHSIFWALLIMGSITLVAIVFFLPETLRSIAGDGSVPLRGIHKPLWYSINGQPYVDDNSSRPEMKPINMYKLVLEPVKMLREKDVLLNLLFGSAPYTIHSMVTASATAMLKDNFGLSQLQVAAAFLANGVGIILGSTVTGEVLDRLYKRYEAEYRHTHEIPEGVSLKTKLLKDFPLEHARLLPTCYVTPVFIVTVCLYGYSILLKSLPLVLVLQFITSFCAMSVLAANTTIMLDMFPKAAASATAVNNLVRCLIGATGVAVVQHAIDGIGYGPTFLVFGLITLFMTPLLALEWFYGPAWRAQRMEREQAEEEKQQRTQSAC
ncbi:MFS general substrate transporter [Apiospora hydei]|uniref:MFS general substrate transporter n=1 Tax=Apiospora hydei TaxID=1337664 RepID=A0ABR1WNN3_9PEZI